MKSKIVYKLTAIAAILLIASIPTVMAWTSMITLSGFQPGNAAYEAGQVGSYAYAYKFDNWGPSTVFPWVETHEGNTITVYSEDGIYFSWTSTVAISAVIVKGGGGQIANVFYYYPDPAYSDTGLYSPINPKTNKPYAVSHVTFCWNADDNGYVPPTYTLSGVKYYDANVNGMRDTGEVGIEGWMIELYVQADGGSWEFVIETFTDSEGSYIFSGLLAGTYKVVEVFPSYPTYIPTTPTEHVVTISTADVTAGLDFGNVCLKPGEGGLTLGYWSNKNGQARIDTYDRAALNALNLFRPNSWAYPPFTSNAQITTYLLSATASNMAWMLSAQLIATTLNIRKGYLNAGTIVYVGSSSYVPSGFITIGDIAANANTALFGNNRAEQEYWKNLLDGLNNNRLPFVCSDPCYPIVYP